MCRAYQAQYVTEPTNILFRIRYHVSRNSCRARARGRLQAEYLAAIAVWQKLSSKDWYLVMMSLPRRQLLSLLSGSLATACTTFDKSPFWQTMAAGVKPPKSATPQITREYADKLPYASMMAWFDNGPRALLVLSEFEPNDRLTWHSAQRQSITTYGPLIVRALGTEIELRNTIFSGPWSSNLNDLTGNRLERQLDIAVEGERVQLVLESRFTSAAIEEVDILGRKYSLRHYREKVRSDGKPRYENSYWSDDQNRCWKSRQIITPRLPHFNIEILKYPQA